MGSFSPKFAWGGDFDNFLLGDLLEVDLFGVAWGRSKNDICLGFGIYWGCIKKVPTSELGPILGGETWPVHFAFFITCV